MKPEVIAAMERLANDLAALRDVLAADEFLEGAPAGRQLAVPWIGQNVPGVSTDDLSNSDCGPACVAMWLGLLGQAVTVDQVSVATGLLPGYRYTTPAHLMVAAKTFGLQLRRVTALTPKSIEAHIDDGRPVIALVHYASLPKRFDQKFTAGHWIIATGYTVTQVTYNDPYWNDETGRGLDMSWAELDRAMFDCALDGNTPRQGLVAAA